MISVDGWNAYSIWEHSPRVTALYTRRARGEAEEMTCAAQAAELLGELSQPGDELLDVGCGTGYFFHSLRARGLDLRYCGVDASAGFIEIGRRIMPEHGLPAERLIVGRIEDLDGAVDHVLCMNVLSNLDNFHRPLERMLLMARKSVVLRESVKEGAHYSYVVDRYLESPRDLKVYVNAYDRGELGAFVRSYGFDLREMTDRRTGGAPEMVIDHPHYWTFLIATRKVMDA